MKKRIDKISLRAPATILWLLITALIVNLTACEQGSSVEVVTDPHQISHDPSKPVIITKFSPETGTVPTQLIIEGSNFGSDISIIRVSIDDTDLKVIGSDGTRVYAMLTEPLSDDPDKGTLKVYVGEEDPIIAEAAEKFRYQVLPYVVTVCGFKNEKNESSSIDGDMSEAQFAELHWLAFDQDKNLYILEEFSGLRFIKNDFKEVKTKFRRNNDIPRMRTMDFTNDYQKMFVTNDQSDDAWNCIGTFELSAEDDFSTPKRVINSSQCNGGTFHPQDGTYFYNNFTDGILLKWDGPSDELNGKINSTELFKINDRGWEFYVTFHPSGDFAYIVVIAQSYILKSYYDREKKELKMPSLFAGSPNQRGYRDGVATTARFNQPYQGCFDEEGNFFVCDKENHCIRKITPQGIVSTFAGRPQSYGYVDSEVRDAQFDKPSGIVYDEDEKVFYVADRDNRRLRKIILPKND